VIQSKEASDEGRHRHVDVTRRVRRLPLQATTAHRRAIATWDTRGPATLSPRPGRARVQNGYVNAGTYGHTRAPPWTQEQAISRRNVSACARAWTRVPHSSSLVMKGSPVRVRVSASKSPAKRLLVLAGLETSEVLRSGSIFRFRGISRVFACRAMLEPGFTRRLQLAPVGWARACRLRLGSRDRRDASPVRALSGRSGWIVADSGQRSEKSVIEMQVTNCATLWSAASRSAWKCS
jgi:hypothetical protein